MKRIVNGKKYDTETATPFGDYQFSGPSDFSYVHEELYRKKNGEFFLRGEGDPMLKYPERCLKQRG